MRIDWSTPKRLFLFAYFVIVVLGLHACGGGTRGTGVGDATGSTNIQSQSKALSGSVVTTDSSRVGGITITILETGQTVETDQDGNFSVELLGTPLDTVTLQISLPNSTLSGSLNSSSEVVRVEIDITNHVVVVLDENGESQSEYELMEL